MYTLLIDGTLMDNLGFVARTLGGEAPITLPLFWLFVLASSMMMLNLLIGVVCDVVSSVAKEENEVIAVLFMKDTMRELFSELDKDNSGKISLEEFLTLL